MTTLQNKNVIAIYCYQLDDYSTVSDFVLMLAARPPLKADTQLPNCIAEWGASVVREHLDSIRHAANIIQGHHDNICFAVELEDGTLVGIDSETENDLAD